MNGIQDVLAKLIQYLCSVTGSPILAVLVFTAIALVCQSPLIKKSLDNIPLSAIIRQEMEDARQRHTRHPEKAEVEIMRIFTLRRYGMFASGICTVFQALLGLVLVIGVWGNPLNLNLTVFGMDLTVSPYVLLNDPYASLTSSLVLSAAICLQLVHDQIMEPELVTDQRVMDIVLLVLSGVACLLLPGIFSMFWVIHEIADMAMVLFYIYGKKPPVYTPIGK